MYLPAGIVAVLSYIFLAAAYGAIGTAVGNIVAYSFFSLFVLLYALRDPHLSRHIAEKDQS